MLADTLKQQLTIDNVVNILDFIGCKNIKIYRSRIQCANPDGDNNNAICVYTNTWHVENYTRPDFQDYQHKDIIALVQYVKDLSFTEAIKLICDICGLDYYNSEQLYSSPSFLQWLNFVESNRFYPDDSVLTPLPESILSQFINIPNKVWLDEGISCEVQRLFEIGIDIQSERITIPIRDENGVLVGVKGRTLNGAKDKYIYLYPCPKTQILYGFYQNKTDIQKSGEAIVVESEKSILKLRSFGYNNAVAIGGKEISSIQAEKLLRLNVQITLAFNQDVVDTDIQKAIEQLRAPTPIVQINVIRDYWNLLQEKESPCDRRDIWEILYHNFKEKIV